MALRGFQHTVAVAADGSVYVADTGNNRIQQFTSSGIFVREWGTHGTGDGEFFDPGAAVGGPGPRNVAVASDGSVYVADTFNHRIQQFNSEGVFVRKWGPLGTGDEQRACANEMTQLCVPRAVAAGPVLVPQGAVRGARGAGQALADKARPRRLRNPQPGQ